MDMNNRFHHLLVEAAGNRMLADLVNRTYHIPLVSSRVVHWYDYFAVRGSHDLHHRVFGYVRDGRAVNAEAAMREHILQAIDQIRDRLEPVGADNVVVLNAHPNASGGRDAG
jgi:GntR family transcriptional regulator of vanillate catabolism